MTPSPRRSTSSEQAPPRLAPSYAELEQLADAHGEGFWLLDLEAVRHNIGRFRGAFVDAGWPATDVAWSYKTLWLPPVVEEATRTGALSEVVSQHEYELALAMGIDPTSIIVNGPLKDRQYLEWACTLGSQVQLDGPDEAADLVALARRSPGRTFRVGLRANIDIGQADRGRFGFDAEAGDLQRAAWLLAAEPGIQVEGLHVHVSAAREPAAYTRRVEKLIRLADELWPDGSRPAYLNVGGGFSGEVPDALAAQMAAPPASPEEYAAAIVTPLRERWPSGGPRLITEPGVALAADVMRFAARVGAVKVVAGRRHAIVAATVHTVKPTMHQMDMPFTVVRPEGVDPPARNTVVSGWSCMERDILSTSKEAPLERGDWVLFDNAGAYTFVMNPRFIRGTPAVLARDTARGEWWAARSADTVEDWLRPFRSRP